MIHMPSHTRVFLAPGITDMRKAINGLSILVQAALELDPFSGHLFVFCNRSQTMIKVLYWDRNGFCLWQKRLEKHRFKWPQRGEQILEIHVRELSFLLEGLDIQKLKINEELKYKTAI
ncbi:MAG: transposase [Synergistales bacterium]|nr:transposase [Synergistales bacterium]